MIRLKSFFYRQIALAGIALLVLHSDLLSQDTSTQQYPAAEFNIGGYMGYRTGVFGAVGASLEYRPRNTFISINTDPGIIFDKTEVVPTIPVYLKLILGTNFRISPSIGVFTRPTRSHGLVSGLHFSYMLNNHFLFSVKGELYKDYWKTTYYGHFGEPYSDVYETRSFQFTLGLKVNLKQK